MLRFKTILITILLSASLVFADQCGEVKVSSSLSIGGEYSKSGQWPWLASLFLRGKYQCGATIINKKFLLGAAHCAHPKGQPHQNFAFEYFAYLGRYELNNETDSNSFQAEFSDIFIHPDWNAGKMSLNYDADIALFEMESEVVFTDYIQPICLPSENAKVFDVNGTVVGYGFSEDSSPHENKPKHVQIKSVEHSICLFMEPSYVKYSSLRMFCAGEKGRNPCRGDSGGPFMVKNDKIWTIIGIVSTAAQSECEDNDFVLFTQVPKFLNWIKEITGEIEPEKAVKEVELDCHEEYTKEVCWSIFIKVLEPNSKVTSITLSKPLNYSKIELIWINPSGNGGQMHYLPDFSLVNEKFPKFNKLSIKAGLKEVERNKLALMPQLIQFDAGYNQIRELWEDVFNDSVNLEDLNIAGNQLKTLPEKLLWKVTKLRKFDASDNRIEAIPERFFDKCIDIEEIHLQQNKIARIDIDVRILSKLKYFDLRRNRCIDRTFDVKANEEIYRSMLKINDVNDLRSLINQNC